MWVDEWFCTGNAISASPWMCLFNLNCKCTCLIILAVTAVGKYCVISDYSEADVLRMEKSFLVIRLWKFSFVTSV